MKSEKNYDPQKYEAAIYQKWIDSRSFSATYRSTDYYSLVLPPPNANANLHLGQFLTVAIEDISARFNRMRGKDTLFVPGADHAGFETWVVYESKLNKEGKTRFDFTNRELYEQVWNFVDHNKQNMISQLKTMGISADWDKFTYTLDKRVISQAYKTFKKMWQDKLIYRGERIVNYCTFHGTSFSDIEVEYKDQKGKLWYLKYPIKGTDQFITVATTRPETMLGDTAVAVSPKDVRYKDLVGKIITLPIVNREIPILADRMVDSDFGTGAVKITPAHDINDYDLAQRHDLPMISVINEQGNMFGSIPEEYLGISAERARELILNKFEGLGLLDHEEEHENRVGYCYKCHTAIQPLLSKQWFVNMKPLADEAIDWLNKSKIKFYPETKLNQSIEYLKNIRDWNISRQIAWGIPIPAFQNSENPDDWIFDDRVELDQIVVEGKTYNRDKDVFDTWFSSGQWPYTVLNFPDGEEFQKFYPLKLMETGGEILYQWVCRMIMLGIYITGDVPFKNVYIHGYVLAEDGSKMSKSIGNVVDPIPLIEKFGSDAVRVGLVVGRSAGVNRGFDIRKIEEGRNFANKLWNIARFIDSKINLTFKYSSSPKPQTAQDLWIIDQLNITILETTNLLDQYRYSEAYDQIYHFMWNNFANWYIECSKFQINLDTLSYCFINILKLAHPFAPFITETIWQELNWTTGKFITTSKWPEPVLIATKGTDFENIIRFIEEIRFIKSQISPSLEIRISTSNKLILENSTILIKLAKIYSVTNSSEGRGLKLQSTSNVWMDIPDQEIKNFIDKLIEQSERTSKVIENLQARLSNKSYLSKAPANLVEETRNELLKATSNFDSLKIQISQFTA